MSGLFRLALVLLLCQLTVDSPLAVQQQLLRPAPGKNDGSDQGSESAGKETYTFGSTPDANFGKEIVAIGQPVSTCNHATGTAYLQFDVTSLPQKRGRVFLGLTPYPHAGSCQSNCVIEVFFYLVAESWNEMNLTFNHAPRLGSAVLGPIRVDAKTEWGPQEFDITPVFRDWRWGTLPNYGLAIASPTAGCNDGSARFGFYTSDHPDTQKRPYLKFVTVDQPTPTDQGEDLHKPDGDK